MKKLIIGLLLSMVLMGFSVIVFPSDEDWIQVDPKTATIWINDYVWERLGVTGQRMVLDGWLDKFSVGNCERCYWIVKLLYSGAKVGQIWPNQKRYKHIFTGGFEKEFKR